MSEPSRGCELKDERIKFLEESPGNKSSIRQMMAVGYLMGFALALYVLYIQWDAGIILPLAFIGAPTTGKVWQKFAEKK